MYLWAFRVLCLVGVASVLSACASMQPSPPTHDHRPTGHYPIHDPLKATVVGTPSRLKAKLPRHLDFSVRSLKPLVERPTPPTLRYARPLQYLAVSQDHPAPLAFVIAGTGASALSSRCVLLSRALYQIGYSVACLPSPTSVNFMLGAAAHPVPGRMPADVHDLYRMMIAVRRDLAGQARITGYALAGWSLGATEAAFIARHDAQVGDFHFSKVLLIDPAVSLWVSVKRMDTLLAHDLPGGGISGLPAFIAKGLGGLQQVYNQNQALHFNENFLYRAYKTGRASDQQTGALIGLAFRLALANMAFAADVLSDSGVIVPRGMTLGAYADLDPYIRRSFRMSFADYINKLLLPYWNRDGRHITKRQLIAEADLRRIQHYLAHDPHIEVFANADDPILDADEVNFLRRTFGDRARVVPYGGHLGNLSYWRTIRAIQGYMSP
jgi:hypothetical protein